MDEFKGMPMPPAPEGKGIFSDEMGAMPAGGGFISTFTNDAGDKAANFVNVELDENGEFLADVPMEELEPYAKGVLDGDEDSRGLMVGEFFEGEYAEDDAVSEAMAMNDTYAPGPDATPEEKAEAVKAVIPFDIAEEEIVEAEEPMLEQFPEE